MEYENETISVVARIMEHEKESLFRYALYRLGDVDDAEDIIQELFLTLCSMNGIVERTDDLRNYIFRSLSNNINTMLRKKEKLRLVPMESVSCELNIHDTQPQNFEQEYMMIEALLGLIPREQSEVIRLHIHGNRTFAEIAAIMNVPLTTVKSRYKYGIDKLRDALKKQGLI